jgi:hypothetical protein
MATAMGLSATRVAEICKLLLYFSGLLGKEIQKSTKSKIPSGAIQMPCLIHALRTLWL